MGEPNPIPRRTEHMHSNAMAGVDASVVYRDIDHTPPADRGLDFGRLETRFLSIDPIPRGCRSAVELSCHLETKSLFDTPKYVALSYSWGDHSATCPILLDGKRIEVTVSLEAALKELLERGVEVVWVDALCIDQNNNYEKVYQLRQMGTIFYQAAKVVAWLGPAADDSNKAMQALSHMPALSGPDMDKQLSADTAAQRNLYWRASRRESLRPYWHTKDDSSNTLQALSKMSELEDVDQHAHAILRLLLRPYWNRVWIIQEIARASRVEVWCGRQMLTWTVFTEGLERWVCWSHVCDASFGHPFVTLRRFREAERNSTKGTARMLLSTALVRTQYAQATLRRDKIYALLGITRDGTETVPTPNYVQDDATVFRSVLRHMIVNQAQLNLILVAGMHGAKESTTSWLPEWNHEQIQPWIPRWYDECIGYRRSAVTSHLDQLDVEGQIVGKLQVLTDSKATLPSEWRAGIIVISSHWRQFRHALDRNVEELSRDDRVHSVVLMTLWYSQQDDNLSRYPRLRQWFEENADVPLDGDTLRSSFETIRNKQVSRLRTAKRFGPLSDWFARTRDCSWLRFEKTRLWLDNLEDAADRLLRHKMAVRELCCQGQSRLVLVRGVAQNGDVVAWLAQCSLPVVLREKYDGTYSLVGEVVGDPADRLSETLPEPCRLRIA